MRAPRLALVALAAAGLAVAQQPPPEPEPMRELALELVVGQKKSVCPPGGKGGWSCILFQWMGWLNSGENFVSINKSGYNGWKSRAKITSCVHSIESTPYEVRVNAWLKRVFF